jgi:lipid A 4'-phosphatase
VAAFLAALILAAFMLATAVFPGLDVALARGFYAGASKGFALRSETTLILLRELGYYLPIIVLALSGLAFLLEKRKPRPGGILTGRRFLFLALSLALGPGLAVNGVLKEVSHRPRPAQIVEFGGASAFRPWYAVDGACAHNCSFASGEVAGATWLLAPASLLPPPWRAPALALASLVTVAVAALRMAFGGHFASDAAAAVLVTLASIFAVGWAVLRRNGEAARFDAEGRRP